MMLVFLRICKTMYVAYICKYRKCVRMCNCYGLSFCTLFDDFRILRYKTLCFSIAKFWTALLNLNFNILTSTNFIKETKE